MNERIKELRKALKMTQAAFAGALGVSRDTVANIECARIEIKDIFIVSICREFGASEEWLRNGTGDMFRQTDEDFGAICAEIGANDENAKNALLKYAELTPEDKKLFWDFVEKFLK